MSRPPPNLLAAGLLGIACWAMAAEPSLAQPSRWEELMAAGARAYQEGRYAKAEQQVKAALKEAETFGPEDPRLAASLNNLALLYDAQGNYAQAEPLYKRSLAIVEKALGPEHPDVATALENYADLLRKTKREAEAENLEARAKAIRAKHGP